MITKQIEQCAVLVNCNGPMEVPLSKEHLARTTIQVTYKPLIGSGGELYCIFNIFICR